MPPGRAEGGGRSRIERGQALGRAHVGPFARVELAADLAGGDGAAQQGRKGGGLTLQSMKGLGGLLGGGLPPMPPKMGEKGPF